MASKGQGRVRGKKVKRGKRSKRRTIEQSNQNKFNNAMNELFGEPEKHFNIANPRIDGDLVMQDLLFGKNPITDDELRALIKKRPAIYSRYAGYLGRR